ncbi:hypothetical protein AWC38_SpisGene18738 [Stylophora pistillata]|uniref:Uncharacterized protein n=1 Tax=Stylophora pistillata TaxID=50429 RepID=A0A2B4RKE3_STYPI|nr:hypothetical protein AWC38_SpisGene18738 [Stylophora pistillata]
MAKTFFASIFALIFLQHSFCGEQSGERAPNSVSDDIAEGYPTGCQVYKHRRFLQCRNAGIDTIPEVKESWQVVNVDLSGNNISSVQFGNGYRSVQSINLERNNITTLSEESIQELEHIHYLSGSGDKRQAAICIEADPGIFDSGGPNLGPTVEDKLLRQMTPDPGSDEVQKPVNSTANAAQIEAKHQAFEKGRVAEIVGVTLAFAAVIVVMSVAFIAM